MSVQAKIHKMSRIRKACRWTIAITTGMSVGGNALHANWSDPISIVIDILPPVLMFFSFELVTRSPLSEARWFHPKRWARPLATVFITGMSAYLSYFNQRAAFSGHTDARTAGMLPIGIDALMIIALVTLVDLNHRIEGLEAIEVHSMAVQEKKSAAVAPKGARPKTKTERVTQLLQRYPEESVQQIQKRAGLTSPSLIYTVRSQLKKDPATADA